VRERALDVLRGLDHRPDVRMEDELEPRGDRDVGDLAQMLRGALPAVVVEGGRPRPGEVLHRRGDEDLAAGGGQLLGRGPRVLARRAELALVHDDGDEAADEPQLVLVEDAPRLGPVVRQPSERTELRRRDAELHHLRQDTLRRELEPPAGDLTDAP
jgi:hypothetical protein